ncbi:MAG: class I SAM-dependent methyltransferase [Anaerolineaceae bacterium]|nr:class I SAM-dependent methyltransferase [Anaerolineaceae bacterium]
MPEKRIYSTEPEDKKRYTDEYDRFYSRFASIYDWFVRIFPTWRNWLRHATPYIEGPRVLEVSFGTGYLLTQYADRFQTYAVDYNRKIASLARDKLKQHDIPANIQIADVEALPYRDASFDTIVNTMAFTGYPDGKLALSEIMRVLKPAGHLVMIDINYPHDGNRIGKFLTRAWMAVGDIIRDMDDLFTQFDIEYTDEQIGGLGSVHLYVARKSEA